MDGSPYHAENEGAFEHGADWIYGHLERICEGGEPAVIVTAASRLIRWALKQPSAHARIGAYADPDLAPAPPCPVDKGDQ